MTGPTHLLISMRADLCCQHKNRGIAFIHLAGDLDNIEHFLKELLSFKILEVQ